MPRKHERAEPRTKKCGESSWLSLHFCVGKCGNGLGLAQVKALVSD